MAEIVFELIIEILLGLASHRRAGYIAACFLILVLFGLYVYR
jgi:hypothetical protein